MTEPHDNEPWPAAAGDPKQLAAELMPPADLEDRTTSELLKRGLLSAAPRTAARPGWSIMRGALAAAACLGLVAVGFLLGRTGTSETLTSPLTGAEASLYALLLYETAGYDNPGGAEAMARYGEYSRWVAIARQRGQFVTGEDLETERGWLLTPGVAEPSPTSAPPEQAALSGLFFVRADSPGQALELARELPHLRHGGMVLVQKTIPTDQPPRP